MQTRVAVNDFLAQRRIAVVGVSRRPEHFSRHLLRELQDRHYDVVPVNPALEKIDGVRCFARVQDVEPRVDAALIITPLAATEAAVRDCAAAGVKRVWLHRGVGQGSASSAAIASCHELGLTVVEGACPLMFLADTPFVHRLHGGLLKLTGRHPFQRERHA